MQAAMAGRHVRVAIDPTVDRVLYSLQVPIGLLVNVKRFAVEHERTIAGVFVEALQDFLVKYNEKDS